MDCNFEDPHSTQSSAVNTMLAHKHAGRAKVVKKRGQHNKLYQSAYGSVDVLYSVSARAIVVNFCYKI